MSAPARQPLSGRRLPDFIAVGPARTGTTWLDQVLRGHVGLPLHRKETEFFKQNYARGIDWYLDYFRECPPELPMGEVCPTYFALEQSRERIAALIPGCRIIVTLRDPVERAYSYFRFMHRNGWMKTGFEEAVLRRRDIRDQNRYAYHIRNWQQSFGVGRVLVCFYDDLEAEPQAYLDRITDFLAIAPIPVAGSPVLSERVNVVSEAPRSRRLAREARRFRAWLTEHQFNETIQTLDRLGVFKFCFTGGPKFEPLTDQVDARLRELFRPDVEELERMTGRDLSRWKTTRSHRRSTNETHHSHTHP